MPARIAAVPDRQVRVSLHQNGQGRIEIAVSDNGIGIPGGENLTRIFAQEFSTRKRGPRVRPAQQPADSSEPGRGPQGPASEETRARGDLRPGYSARPAGRLDAGFGPGMELKHQATK